MNDAQRQMLDRGLAEFDRAVRGRRRRRTAATTAALVLLVVSAAAIAFRATSGPRPAEHVLAGRPLPAYVELITDDRQLTVELELASACERIGRREGRIYVVECAR